MSDRPIGVFDSGLGGLTVLRALGERMPREHLVYFGDTAHVPYGSKSARTVTKYSLAAARFLTERKIKALVVACNTASALSLSEISRAVKVPVLGVIKPGADAAAAISRSGRVGVIGTEATVASGAYPAALRARRSGLRIWSKACPLFVPLVEEGLWSHRATLLLARHYLRVFRSFKIDTLILGCTHYPLLMDVIRRAMGSGVSLIDSAQQTALEAERLLLGLGLLRGRGTGSRRFFVSDAPERFSRLARKLLGVSAARAGLYAFDA
jgi:glutamate racemase